MKHLRSLVGVVRGSDPFLTVGCPLQSRCPPADCEAACMEVGKTCALPPDTKVCGGKGRLRLPCQEQGSGGRFLGMQGAACTPLLGATTAVGASRGGPHSTAPLLPLSPPSLGAGTCTSLAQLGLRWDGFRHTACFSCSWVNPTLLLKGKHLEKGPQKGNFPRFAGRAASVS